MARNPSTSASALLTYYGFDLNGRNLDQVIRNWLRKYPPKWVVAAVIEALYQGRYKAASVDCILFIWCLRGRPLHHFDYEFADIVCSNILRSIPLYPVAAKAPQKQAPVIQLVQKKRANQKPSRPRKNWNSAAA
jgi:hypothetical protein